MLGLVGIQHERDAAALFDPLDAACAVGAAPRQHHGRALEKADGHPFTDAK
jgi:hypothetical protein